MVRGLTGGLSYEHSVRGVRGSGSNIVRGHWADGEEATALDESPAMPTGLVATTTIGFRGILLEWNVVGDAADYEVETSSGRGGSTTTVTMAAVEVTT